MRHLWPAGTPGRELDREALSAVYAYPGSSPGHPGGPDEPFVRVNFVASADGAVSVDGVSGGLSAPGDGEVFGTLRELADVVLAGSGTVRAEGYRGVRVSAAGRARRRARGQPEVPPVAVVTATCSIEPDAALFTDTEVPPLVLTARSAPADRVAAVREAGGEIVEVGDDDVGADGILAALGERGLARVLCEGGAALFGTLLAADRVDELCLSLAPQLAGPGAGRIVDGPGFEGARAMRLASVLAHDDALLLRWRTRRGDARADTSG